MEEVVSDFDKDVTIFRITFANGNVIEGLPSEARSIRSKQGRIVLDEGAFVDDLDELLAAALAMLMWGGQPVQPEAAIAFWASRSAMTVEEIKALADGAKMRAFYVAGLAERDAVQTIKDAIDEALKNGETLADFKERIKDVIDSQGWHDHRVETIFRNNQQRQWCRPFLLESE